MPLKIDLQRDPWIPSLRVADGGAADVIHPPRVALARPCTDCGEPTWIEDGKDIAEYDGGVPLICIVCLMDLVSEWRRTQGVKTAVPPRAT
jgi:hypothetical protein